MRHGIAGNKLNRKTSHRKATVRDIAKATLIRERICTTKMKAKEARKLVDKLITLGKKGELANKRKAFSILCDHKLVSELFNKIAPRFVKREGGYTRIIPCGNRKGDNAELAFLELTEKAEVVVSKPKSKKTSKADLKDKTSVKKEPASKEEETVSKKETEPVKEETLSKDSKITHGHQDKQTPHDQEKEKAGKKIVGGFKKMFQRKAPKK